MCNRPPLTVSFTCSVSFDVANLPGVLDVFLAARSSLGSRGKRLAGGGCVQEVLF